MQKNLTNFIRKIATMKDRENILSCLPYFVSGTIVKGFGRGSKELGIPTANFPMEVVRTLPEELDQGVYYGWANVDNGDVHKVVLSIGWNPFYENKEKSMETHIIHNFGRDLYGSLLKVCILGYLRPELDFDSLEALVGTIKNDISQAEGLLEEPSGLKYKNHAFFGAEIIEDNNSSQTTLNSKV